MQVFRYEVPVEDRWTKINAPKEVVHVDTRAITKVEFWALRKDDEPYVTYEYRVFGTGELAEGEYVGSVVASQYLVWHLFRREVKR